MLVQKLLNINKYKRGTNLADFFPETVVMFNIYSVLLAIMICFQER